MAYVYILQDRISKRFYVGSCVDLERRVSRHKKHTGGKTTKKGDWQLIRYAVYENIAEARRVEKLVKSYKGGNAFKKIISGKSEKWRGGRVA